MIDVLAVTSAIVLGGLALWFRYERDLERAKWTIAESSVRSSLKLIEQLKQERDQAIDDATEAREDAASDV